MARFFSPQAYAGLSPCEQEFSPSRAGVIQYPNKPRIVSPVNFAKQTPRPDLASPYDVHPLRFVAFNTRPRSSSSTRHVSTPSLRRFTKRPALRVPDYSQDLSPNHRLVLKQQPQAVPFHKQVGRSKSTQKPLCADIPQRMPEYSGVDPKPRTPLLSQGRPESQRLPVFMLKVGHRELLCEKMLKMNSYFDRGLSPARSSFVSTPNRRRRVHFIALRSSQQTSR